MSTSSQKRTATFSLDTNANSDTNKWCFMWGLQCKYVSLGHNKMRSVTIAAICLLLAACANGPNESLLKAASQGDVTAIQEALNKGADINFSDEEGNDALGTAAEHDHPECVRVLLKRGAKIRYTNSRFSPPEVAALMGHDDVLLVFFEEGFSPNWQGPSGRTLLHAAAEGQDKTVRLLLKKGAPVDAKQQNGETPLFLAVGFNYDEVVKVLLAAGADPNSKNKDGNCPLTLALAENRDEIAKELRAYGAKTCK